MSSACIMPVIVRVCYVAPLRYYTTFRRLLPRRPWIPLHGVLLHIRQALHGLFMLLGYGGPG